MIEEGRTLLDLDGRLFEKRRTLLDLDGRMIEKRRTLLDLDGRMIEKRRTPLELDGRLLDERRTLLDLDGRRIEISRRRRAADLRPPSRPSRRSRPECPMLAPRSRGETRMSITLNHTIVPARDKVASARFFARIFGLEAGPAMGPFTPVRINDTLTLDFDDRGSTRQHLDWHHYAFQVSEDEFDAILERIEAAGIPYGSGPHSLEDGRINRRHGGRGVYFRDPNGHVLEVLTRD